MVFDRLRRHLIVELPVTGGPAPRRRDSRLEPDILHPKFVYEYVRTYVRIHSSAHRDGTGIQRVGQIIRKGRIGATQLAAVNPQ